MEDYGYYSKSNERNEIEEQCPRLVAETVECRDCEELDEVWKNIVLHTAKLLRFSLGRQDTYEG